MVDERPHLAPEDVQRLFVVSRECGWGATQTRVMLLTLDGWPTEAIAERLGLTAPQVEEVRMQAVRDLVVRRSEAKAN